MFHAFRGACKLRKFSDHDSPYFPCRYLRRQIVVYMCHQRDKIWKHKSASLRSKYGLDDEENSPISYRQYLINMLKRSTWGEDVVIHALACQFRLKITVINAGRESIDESRYRHKLPMGAADMLLIYNGNNHYSFAGR